MNKFEKAISQWKTDKIIKDLSSDRIKVDVRLAHYKEAAIGVLGKRAAFNPSSESMLRSICFRKLKREVERCPFNPSDIDRYFQEQIGTISYCISSRVVSEFIKIKFLVFFGESILSD